MAHESNQSSVASKIYWSLFQVFLPCFESTENKSDDHLLGILNSESDGQQKSAVVYGPFVNDHDLLLVVSSESDEDPFCS